MQMGKRMNHKQIQKLLNKLDVDNIGEVSFGQLSSWWHKQSGKSKGKAERAMVNSLDHDNPLCGSMAASVDEVEPRPNGTDGSRLQLTPAIQRLYSEEHGRPYWHNTATGAVSWTDPAVPAHIVESGENISESEMHFDLAASDSLRDTVNHRASAKLSPERHRRHVVPPPSQLNGADKVLQRRAAPPLPIQKLYSEDQKRPYWHNTATGEVTWADPHVHIFEADARQPADGVSV